MPFLRSRSTHHAQEPPSGTRHQPPGIRQNPLMASNLAQHTRRATAITTATHRHAPERRYLRIRRRSLTQDHSRAGQNRDHPPHAHAFTRAQDRPGPAAENGQAKTARPETHQNLIHTDKDQTRTPEIQAPKIRASRRQPRPPLPQEEPPASRRTECSAACQAPGVGRQASESPGDHGLRISVRVRSAAASPAATTEMEMNGFEPSTPCLQSRCSPS